ncbi:hypothetical protein GSI_05101 [Ganoderma sinense ZZ0214-1]|uniref:Uncharacterized protein n=1 Tax=Ganoderma sinense ZZ0214-1 TaxID=1077348 RepID=A0A2G8SGU7_9APHY|nr:hypothetical protein GSI_05101 [Ganoderma sinense ZZ0214-1]
MVHGLPNLKKLTCYSVHWIAPGGSHPEADFTKQPKWAAGKDTLPSFAPKLLELELSNIAMYGAKQLIWTRGPHLTWLALAIPVLSDLEEPADGSVIDLGSCTGLETLNLLLTSQFSINTHARFVTELLASWKPLHLNPVLQLSPECQSDTTRQDFAEALRGLGTITEAWLQTLEEPPPSGEIQDHQQVKYRLEVYMHESEAEIMWWLDHLESCFPTWMKLGRIELGMSMPRDEWADEEKSPRSEAVDLSEVEEVESDSLSKVKD